MDLLVGGLALGGIYALTAMGIVLIFKSTNVVNFAQGEVLMVGAYVYLEVSAQTSSAALQIIATMGAGAVAGAVLYAITNVLTRGSQGEAAQLRAVMGTLAILILSQAVARDVFTDNPRRAEPWLFGVDSVSIAGASISVNSLVTLGIIVVLCAGLLVWFERAPYGKAMTAVAENTRASALAGLPVRRLLAGSWVFGGVLAAVAGMMLAPVTGVFPTMGAAVLIPAFIGALIGGFSSLPGALVGSFVLGVGQTYIVSAAGGSWREIVTFAVLLVLLLFRPTGLFGDPQMRQA